MASQSASMLSRFVSAINHPEHGWKTTHFWGPVANWGLVGAAVYDASFKGPEIIDPEMTATMIGYSGLFMGFAWQVQRLISTFLLQMPLSVHANTLQTLHHHFLFTLEPILSHRTYHPDIYECINFPFAFLNVNCMP